MTGVPVNQKAAEQGELEPAGVGAPTPAAVMVRSADSGEWMPTSYVPRGSNRLY